MGAGVAGGVRVMSDEIKRVFNAIKKLKSNQFLRTVEGNILKNSFLLRKYCLCNCIISICIQVHFIVFQRSFSIKFENKSIIDIKWEGTELK